MTITLEVTQEAKESLAAQAHTHGLSLDAFLQNVIAAQAAAVEPVNPVQAVADLGEDPDRKIDEIFDLFPVAPEAGEGAAKRSGWYR